MSFKSKIKSLIAIVFLSFGLSACDNTPDYSGTYIHKTKHGDTYIYTFKKLSNNEYLGELKDSAGGVMDSGKSYLKDEKYLFDSFGSLVGEFKNKDEFVKNNGNLYKKSK